MSKDVPVGYKLTEVGVIPEDWDIYTIRQTVTLINGCAFKPEDWQSQGFPIIRIQNLNDLTAPYNYYSGAVNDRYYVNYGDVLFAWSGTKESSFGARMWRGEKAILNQHIFRVIPNQEKLTSDYTLLVLKKFQEEIERKSHGFKASFVHIKKSDLESTQLAIPPLPEQEAISLVLSDTDALITSLDKLIAKKRDIKQSAMQQLLTGKDHWEEKKLGQIAEFINGRAYNITEWETRGVPVIRLQNLTGRGEDYYYSNLKLPEKQYCNYGDLLFMWSATFGAVIWKGGKAIFHYHIWKIECDTQKLDKGYLFYILLDITERLKNHSSSGGTMLHVTKQSMESTKIYLPPLEEQQAISKVLSDMDSEISALEQRRDKTKALRQAMMQELLTGRIRLL